MSTAPAAAAGDSMGNQLNPNDVIIGRFGFYRSRYSQDSDEERRDNNNMGNARIQFCIEKVVDRHAKGLPLSGRLDDMQKTSMTQDIESEIETFQVSTGARFFDERQPEQPDGVDGGSKLKYSLSSEDSIQNAIRLGLHRCTETKRRKGGVQDASASSSGGAQQQSQQLQLRDTDVLFAEKSEARVNRGNRVLMDLVQKHVSWYLGCRTVAEGAQVIDFLVHQVRKNDGRFLDYDGRSECWKVIKDEDFIKENVEVLVRLHCAGQFQPSERTTERTEPPHRRQQQQQQQQQHSFSEFARPQPEARQHRHPQRQHEMAPSHSRQQQQQPQEDRPSTSRAASSHQEQQHPAYQQQQQRTPQMSQHIQQRAQSSAGRQRGGVGGGWSVGTNSSRRSGGTGTPNEADVPTIAQKRTATSSSASGNGGNQSSGKDPAQPGSLQQSHRSSASGRDANQSSTPNFANQTVEGSVQDPNHVPHGSSLRGKAVRPGGGAPSGTAQAAGGGNNRSYGSDHSGSPTVRRGTGARDSVKEKSQERQPERLEGNKFVNQRTALLHPDDSHFLLHPEFDVQFKGPTGDHLLNHAQGGNQKFLDVLRDLAAQYAEQTSSHSKLIAHAISKHHGAGGRFAMYCPDSGEWSQLTSEASLHPKIDTLMRKLIATEGGRVPPGNGEPQGENQGHGKNDEDDRVGAVAASSARNRNPSPKEMRDTNLRDAQPIAVARKKVKDNNNPREGAPDEKNRDEDRVDPTNRLPMPQKKKREAPSTIPATQPKMQPSPTKKQKKSTPAVPTPAQQGPKQQPEEKECAPMEFNNSSRIVVDLENDDSPSPPPPAAAAPPAEQEGPYKSVAPGTYHDWDFFPSFDLAHGELVAHLVSSGWSLVLTSMSQEHPDQPRVILDRPSTVGLIFQSKVDYGVDASAGVAAMNQNLLLNSASLRGVLGML